jgi:hypothetical protein
VQLFGFIIRIWTNIWIPNTPYFHTNQIRCVLQTPSPLSTPKRPDRLTTTQPPIQRTPGVFPYSKAAGAWSWPLPLPLIQLKIAWVCTFSPRLYFQGLDRDSFSSGWGIQLWCMNIHTDRWVFRQQLLFSNWTVKLVAWIRNFGWRLICLQLYIITLREHYSNIFLQECTFWC